tara:strand:+ start:460 stop:639 length:180 start_codon:yes stop_codon:yes gene_type:complete
MSSVKNPQNVKRQLDEVDNMIMILEDTVRRGMKIDPAEAQRRFKVIREKIKFAQDNIQG